MPRMRAKHLGIGRIGDVPGLVAFAAEGAQQIDLVRVALAELLAVAHARHLRGARLAVADGARDMGEIFRVLRDR